MALGSSLSIPRLVIAACSSGSGKTTTMLAVARALRDRGLRVVCFKAGPDYLDPSYHQQNLQRPCHNLDGWMMGREAVLRTFARATEGADIALIEGVMGLFDGAGPTTDIGSTAEIAKWLKAPVLLVADASGMARSIDAIASGFKHYDADLHVAGLIANRVGSEGHLKILKEACQSLPVLGGFPRREQIAFDERHLGLVSVLKKSPDDPRFNEWAQLAKTWLHLDAILDIARKAPALETPASLAAPAMPKRCRIAYAYDEAFHFYYDDNLGLLQAFGAELIAFSPLHDESLPPCDGIYLGGGYPEVHARRLSENLSMKAALQQAAAAGKPIYGECGGLIYLSEGLIDRDGQRYAMLGLLPGYLQMHDKLQALGYVEVEVTEDSFLGEAGLRFRGHEFRYSSYGEGHHARAIYKIRKRRNQEIRQEGYQAGSVLGSYVHAHWASNPNAAEHFVTACAKASSFKGKHSHSSSAYEVSP